MSFRRKDSVSPACDHILLPIDSGTKQVSRNICERNIHVPILASLQAQVSTGSCHTWARYRGVPAWEMLDAETVKRGIPGRAPGLRASWVPSPIRPVVSDLCRLPKQSMLSVIPELFFRLSKKPAPREVLSRSPGALSLEKERRTLIPHA